MKFLPLVWRNAWRSKRRTVLTVLAIGMSLFILLSALSLISGWATWEERSAQRPRVVVMSTAGLGHDLPVAHENDLVSLPGVEQICKLQWFGGKLKNDTSWGFANFAVDAEKLLPVWPEYKISKEALDAFLQTRTGTLVGRKLAAKYGWKQGDRFTLQGTIFPCNPELLVVGIFSAEMAEDENQLFFQFKYFEELMKAAGQPAIVGTFWLKVRDMAAASAIIPQIDNNFQNSPDPTRTVTEKEFAAMFRDMMGGFFALVRNIALTVVAAIILIAANTMAMAARERTSEIAVMKTLGFSPGRILSLVLSEALGVSLLGTAVGIGGAWLLFNGLNVIPPDYGVIRLGPTLTSLGAGLLTGLLSGIVPAWRAAQLNIVEALRKVA